MEVGLYKGLVFVEPKRLPGVGLYCRIHHLDNCPLYYIIELMSQNVTHVVLLFLEKAIPWR